MLIKIFDQYLKKMSNIPSLVLEKKKRGGLHKIPNHPLQILKQKIYNYFGKEFTTFDNLDPIVTIKANFDDLLIPPDHPCRSTSDTYYVDSDLVLRTQTSAHQTELLRAGYTKFLVTGDVYRKDEINSTHYPVFHQMEGVCVGETQDNLLCTMKGLMEFLFPGCKCRVNDDYFPFTYPSYEVEVEYKGKWLEVAGCGMIQTQILQNTGHPNKYGWAFGLGLERLAMVLFDIPDIRLFWSQDLKFLSQFSEDNAICKFRPFSVLDSLSKDLSFFIPSLSDVKVEWKDVNDFYDICRNEAGDLLEKVERFDCFLHPVKNMVSHSYRLTYSPPDTLVNGAEFNRIVNSIHSIIYEKVKLSINVIMR